MAVAFIPVNSANSSKNAIQRQLPCFGTTIAGRVSVDCALFPLYELANGVQYRINIVLGGASLEDNTSRQKHFVRKGAGFGLPSSRIAEQ